MRPLFPLLLCATTLSAVNEDPQDLLSLMNFEGDGYDNWQIEGPAFGLGPSTAVPEELGGPALGYSDESFASSAQGGLATQGSLTSPPLVIQHSYLSLSLAGAESGVGVELLIDGKAVHQASGQGDFTLRHITWDLQKWQGQEAVLHVFDRSETGAILLDALIFHGAEPPPLRPPTLHGQLIEPGLVPTPTLPGVVIPEGTTLTVFADHQEHSVTSPTSLTVAEDGRLFVAETHRFRYGVEDNRDHLYWVMDDLASTSTADRRRLHEKWQAEVPLAQMTERSEKVRTLVDSDDDGRADFSQIFADGFNDVLDGTGAGVFAFDGTVYFACIPTIWALQDNDGDGVAEDHFPLQSGFGTRVSLSGHDLNGFTLGPDGRLYGSVGDRALNLTTFEGVRYTLTDQGAAFRFEPDGSNFEIFHTGLRNPKEIAFNQFGDAFSVDNNADMGDKARIVYLVDGADSGWRTDHQIMHTFHREIGLEKRPPNIWMKDRMWETANAAQPAWLLPPIGHLSNGPSGLTFQPGTALGGEFANQFFICDYKGGPSASGVYSFGLQPHGTSYELSNPRKFIWGSGATDIDFGFNGTAYLTDFVTGWKSAPQGRVLALSHQNVHPQAEEVAELVREGLTQREPQELAQLLSHPDQRIRLRAQIALTTKPRAVAHFYSQLHLRDELLDLPPENLLLPPLDFDDELRSDNTPMARLHATWGLAMMARRQKDPYATAALVGLLKSPDDELRAQAAKALGEAPVQDVSSLIAALRDRSLRVRFFAALSLGRLGEKEAFQPLLSLAITAADLNDPYLRHAAVVGLSGCSDANELQTLSGHALPAVRLAALLALRRLNHLGVNRFLFDHTPEVRNDAIRIIHDLPNETARLVLPDVVDELLEKQDRTVPPMIWRRLIHSCFRLSTPENAQRLFAVAAAESVPLEGRREALRLLQQWTKPHPVDQSLGRFAPLRPRPLDDIRPLIRSQLTPLLAPNSPVLAEAVALISQYKTTPDHITSAQLLTLVENADIATEGRVQILRFLASDADFDSLPLLRNLVRESLQQPSLLRQEALSLLAEKEPQASFPWLSQGIQSADLAYRQRAAHLLAANPHPEVPLLLVAYLDRIREGEEPDLSIELEMIAAARASDHPAVRQALSAYQTQQANDPLASSLQTLWGGDPARGRELFLTHPASQCARCHLADRRKSAKGMAGPHLAGIGQQPRRKLLEALVNPSATIAAGFAPISAALTNGEILSGTILERTDEHLDLEIEGKALRVAAGDIASTSDLVSPMPAMGLLLQPEEIRDVVAYLATLKTPQQKKNPLAQQPERYQLSTANDPTLMAEESTPTQDPAGAESGIPEGVDAAFWELGKKQYDTPGSCTTCHQPTGAGLTGAFPPLAGSEWVTGPVENLIQIQLRGLSGEIKVNGQVYNSVMPPMAQQTDEQIAAVLTYVRNSWGNKASAVTVEQVAALRGEAGKPMITAVELIDPATAPKEAPAEGEARELAPAVTDQLPKVESRINFPAPLFTFPFIVVVLLASAKFLVNKKA